MNLQTGETEARLERNKSEKDRALKVVKHYQVIESGLERESLGVILHHCHFS